MAEDTIVALSSGSVPSGVAVVRLSGSACQDLLNSFTSARELDRHAGLQLIRDPADGEIIDRGLVIGFAAPKSFTGEDCLEFHVHGGRAVVERLLTALVNIDGVRLAEAGEFSRRAFQNGKIDLTAAEGLADLVAAETEQQRKLAIAQSSGAFATIYEEWRSKLIYIMAMHTAEIDFVDEDDVPEDASNLWFQDISALVEEIGLYLDDNRAGEIIHDGFRVVLMGRPNAGKSSLLNALAKRDVAIVTDEAGTTRDMLEVRLDVGGFEVRLFDTAGIRDAKNIVEVEGIRRAQQAGEVADLVVWLEEKLERDRDNAPEDRDNVIFLLSKDDQGTYPEGVSISAASGHGIDWLVSEIRSRLGSTIAGVDSPLITRFRHREALLACHTALTALMSAEEQPIELRVEGLRSATAALGRITGIIDVEDLLDVIFSEFCVGK